MLETLRTAVQKHGLIICGCVDGGHISLPRLANGKAAQSLVLVGVAGSTFWPEFTASGEYCDRQDHPLDRWSRRIAQQLAQQFDATAVYPFGENPPQPFLQWAQAAGQSVPSQLGLFIHHEFGLWQAYRFALLFASELENRPSTKSPASPCHQCANKPCLDACPVSAFSDAGYDVRACTNYLRKTPDALCHQVGCLARRACPVGTSYRYLDQHANFHMRAFLRLPEIENRREES